MNLSFVTFPIFPIKRRSSFPRNIQERARQLVSAAIYRGLLTHQSCCACGSEDAAAHHDDYNKPNVVSFLCLNCHRARHRELGWGIPHRGSQPGVPVLNRKPAH